MKPFIAPAVVKFYFEAAFGPRWREKVASRFRVSARTVRRWTNGETPLPTRKARWLLSTHPDRVVEIDAFIDQQHELAELERTRRKEAAEAARLKLALGLRDVGETAS